MNANKINPLVFLGTGNLILAVADFYGLLSASPYVLYLVNAVFCSAVGISWLKGQGKPVEQKRVAILNGEVTTEENLVNLKVFKLLPNFLCLKDAKGRWLQASDNYLRLFGLQEVNYKGKTNFELRRLPGVNVKALSYAEVQDSKSWQLMRPVKETITLNGQKFDVIRKPVLDGTFKKTRLLIIADFVQKDTETQSVVVQGGYGDEMLAKGGISMAYCDSHFGWALLDCGLRILESNTQFSALFGYDVEELRGKQLASLVATDFAFDPNFAFSSGNELWSKEIVCQHKQGHYRSVALNISQINVKNEELGYFVSAFDITRQKKAESKILRIAHYDDLTGLVNRVMFFNRLSRLMPKHIENQRNSFVVVFFIDLDRFKAVNDSLGHDAGDQLLKKAAQRLESVVRKNDMVARLSGDEFAVMMVDNVSHEHAIYSASMIAEKIVQTLSEPFYINRSEVFIGASVGIAVYPEDAKSPEELLKLADISMYEAKKQGRNNYQFYKKSYAIAWRDRLAVEKDLRKALEKKELELFFQPQYSPDGNQLCGAEVLVRWMKETAGGVPRMIPPDQFIGIAEETGLIVEMGRWILERACRQLKYWQGQGFSLSRIAVNVSPRQFADNKFLQTVEEVLKNTELGAEYLELELTESMLIGDVKQIELQLKRLKKMGVALVLDDFGTGYSSLSYLRNFPIDVVKIDKSFIQDTPNNTKNARIVSAIIHMGHSLGQKVVAEGVETEEQLRFLKMRGCDVIQGYYFSRPLPMSKMTDLLEKEQKRVGIKNGRVEESGRP